MLQNTIKDKIMALEKATENLWHVANMYPENALTYKPNPDVWSPLEVLYHLFLSEKMSRIYAQRFLSKGQNTPRAGIKSQIGMLKLRIGNALPLKIKAPEPVAKMPQELHAKTVQEAWKTQREELKIWLAGLSDEVLLSTCFRHPIAGDISLVQMLDFFMIHLKRHEKQFLARLK